MFYSSMIICFSSGVSRLKFFSSKTTPSDNHKFLKTHLFLFFNILNGLIALLKKINIYSFFLSNVVELKVG
jgi:hypothetical protein